MSVDLLINFVLHLCSMKLQRWRKEGNHKVGFMDPMVINQDQVQKATRGYIECNLQGLNEAQLQGNHTTTLQLQV
jgi:hypothetical protein